ncbi:hypothetical protein ACFLQN_04015 [Candidatus Aenigmatarchaeota archaeon]
MKIFALAAILIVATLIVSGCVDGGVTSIAKSLPQAQEFLNNHPNADIRVILLPEESVEENIDEIRAECGEEMVSRSYYKATFIEGDTKLIMYLDSETRDLICFIKEGEETEPEVPIDCDPLVCPDGTTLECTGVGGECMCPECTSDSEDSEDDSDDTGNDQDDEFCGSSTEYSCERNSDCAIAGCSGQVCKGVDEETGGVTTCEALECYNEEIYGLGCGCVDNVCKWANVNDIPEDTVDEYELNYECGNDECESLEVEIEEEGTANVYINGDLYEVKLEGVAGALEAVVTINSETESVTKGNIYTIGGISVYISDIFYSNPHPASSIKILFGEMAENCDDCIDHIFTYECGNGECESLSLEMEVETSKTLSINGDIYDVELVSVESATAAVITVGGESKSVTKGESYTISGVHVYVSDIFYSNPHPPSSISLVFGETTDNCEDDCYDEVFTYECGNGVCELMDVALEEAGSTNILVNEVEYEITLLEVFVNSTGNDTNETVAVIDINNEGMSVTEGNTYTIGGLEVYIHEIIFNNPHPASSIKILIGERLETCPDDCTE